MTRMVEIEIGKVAVIESGEGINIVLRCSSNFIASAEISKFREEMNIWYFNRLIVPARFRNLGYGKKLLTKLVQVCKEKKIKLDISASREALDKLQRKYNSNRIK